MKPVMSNAIKTFCAQVRQRHRRRGERDRQSGVALMMTVSALALLITLVSEFTYDTHIQAAQAANARDEVRAHYMARSAVNLSRLLVKIQSRFVEPFMQQAQSMLAGTLGSGMGISLRVTDYAGPIMGFFGGRKDEVSSLGGLMGLDVTQAKGLGMANGRIDAEITSEDGKINVNCGSGRAPTVAAQAVLFRQLAGLFYSPRYNRLFERENADGQFVDRLDLASAIIDWADGDEQKFSIMGASVGSEDYRYDARDDRYYAHNDSYDTMEELAMVRGMSTDMLEAFSPYLTAYANGDQSGQCKVNLRMVKGDCTPLLVGLIRAAAFADPTQPPTDPTIMDDRFVYPLASILCERGSIMGFDNLNTIVSVLNNPAQSISREDPRYQMMQSMRGLTITRAQLEQVAFVASPRIYKIVATGQAGKVTKKITAILDANRDLFNPLSQNVLAERAAGVLQYWREE